jgi:hypothetical protein
LNLTIEGGKSRIDMIVYPRVLGYMRAPEPEASQRLAGSLL